MNRTVDLLECGKTAGSHQPPRVLATTSMTHAPLLRFVRCASWLSAACLIAACTSPAPSPDDQVVRTVAPQNAAKAIESYFDVTVKGKDPSRELVVGTPQRGACPMGGTAGGYVGWVVPVEYKTRSKDNGTVVVSSYFFWFSDESIRGVTRRIEVCP